MKKIFIYLGLIISSFYFIGNISDIYAAGCSYSWAFNVDKNVENCFNNWWSSTVEVTDASIETGFKSMIVNWIDNIAVLLWVMAVWSLIYGALSMTLSTWDDEKIKKSKDIVKWSLIWFIAVLSATTIVTLVINFMYEIWDKI